MADVATSDLIISAEFTDILSSQMLVTPDPQFVFARWAYSALVQNQMSQLDGYDMAMLTMREGRITETGIPANMDESMSSGMGGPLMVANQGMLYPDMFMMVKEAAGPGTTIKIDRPRFTDGLTTEANRRLTTQTKLFGNSQAVTMDQVDVTIYEYSGPGDGLTGAPAPINLSLFTQHRSKHDLLRYVGYQLRRDRYKFMDDVVINRLIAAASATSTGTTRGADAASNAAMIGGGNEPFTFDLILKAVEALKLRFVPGIALDGRYVMILHPHQIQQLKNDPAYQRLSVFMPNYNVLFPGYSSTVENVILCESQRLPLLSNLGSGANQTGYQGLVIAPNVLGWASARDAFAVRDKNDDGGRFAKFGWLAFEGWQILDDRFVQLIITD